MNGLTLRISGGGSKKTKNNITFPTVSIPEKDYLHIGGENEGVQKFLKASSVEEQLTTLKNILNSSLGPFSDELNKFLVIIFLQAEVKHPVKCFLTRYITKSDNLQHPFSIALSEEIMRHIADRTTSYSNYKNVVTKVASCIENFPAGDVAVKMVEIELAEYLVYGLTHFVKILRSQTDSALSPTEKNEYFILVHSILRIILYVIQRVSDNSDKLITMFIEIRANLKDLFFDEDVPMDTKSVCGIVYVSMHILENGPDSWVYILTAEDKDEILQSLLSNNASKLSLYSALVIVVPAVKLQTQVIDGVPAIIALTENIINIGESTSSESTFNLGVTRTLVQISKCLERNIEKQTGLRLVDTLLLHVWPHLDHYMDSVRHLSAQALAGVVRYCTGLQAAGDSSALDKLFSALDSLDRNRKSFYVSLTALTAELGASAVMARMPALVEHVLARLHVQAVQASATTTLETLLHAHMARSPTEEIYQRWVKPIVNHAASADCIQLGILEDLLSKAVRLDDRIMEFILPHIQQTCDEPSDSPNELKCALMLLGVARGAGAVKHAGCPCAGRWKGVIGYDVLRRAAVDPLQQTRILSLSLIVESPKSTEVFTSEELDFVLYFLKYNCNAQAPNFRQLVLSLMKKFVKRFEDSYKVLLRQKDTNDAENKTDYYLQFVESLRAQCFDSLILGANYGRRYVALQVLVWCEYMQLDGYERNWTTEYVDKLIDRLGDSYDNNKAFALEILKRCPTRLLKGYAYGLNMKKVVSLASSVKPSDCVWAAYTLQLLLEKLPHEILQGEGCSGTPEAVTYKLLRRLLQELQKQLAVCRGSVVGAARDAPMYGLLHCITHVVDRLDAEMISQDDAWTGLIAEIISTCMEVNAAVACVVNNSSPEGHLPMDMGGVEVTDHGNSGNVRLDDGRPVTAQMVLLCAWRSVKEVSLLLGSICSRLVISSPDSKGSLQARQLVGVGEHFTKLLSETKHRGAFEQAYVGFCRLLTRLWRCRSPELHELPRAWLDELMLAIQSPEAQGRLCATRRSAGLPFMIQALVSTELQVRGNPTCFHACMCTLLRQSRAAPAVTPRTHAANILRALFRNAALHDAVAPYVGEGLAAALAGFQGDTWEERNSSTLLFSALTVRIFGVQRSRDLEKLCIRNRMTGRIFFLRYPQLYDLMLGELEASSRQDRDLLRPLLYPILLLLARLYPSSLEGTVSNLKLVAFIPHVVACARSGVLKTRQLAAKAVVPLISPEQYVPHLQEMFKLLRDENINRNYCHGILLQINRLIDNKPSDVQLDSEVGSSIMEQISASTWIVKQSSRLPCYLIVDEYIKMISLLLWRFSSLPYSEIIDTVTNSLNDLLFDNHIPEITSGRDVCLANAAYLLFIISNLFKIDGTTHELLLKCLSHKSYEVVLSALNHILILHEEIEIDDKLQTHLSLVSKKETLDSLNNPTVYSRLCDIIKSNRYLECTQKALKVLTLSGDTQPYIIQAKQDDLEVTHETILQKLIHFIENEHENMTHIYLQSLSNFLTKMLKDNSISSKSILEAIRVVFARSLSDNSDNTRKVVVAFLDANIERLLELDLKDLPEEERFEFKATLYSTLVTMLEDDDVSLSQRTCDLICRALGVPGGVIPSRCGEMLRDHIERDGDAIALFTTLALLDFKSEVVVNDEESDEYRVFDQNERYNIYLEETIWTKACAEKIASIHKDHETLLVSVQALTTQKTYKPALDKLCGLFHLEVFNYFVMKTNRIPDIENIKSEVFAKLLHEYELKLHRAKFEVFKENIEQNVF